MDIIITIIEIVVIVITIYVVGLLLTALISKVPFKGESLSNIWKKNGTVNFNLGLWFILWILIPVSWFIDNVINLGRTIVYFKKKDKKKDSIGY